MSQSLVVVPTGLRAAVTKSAPTMPSGSVAPIGLVPCVTAIDAPVSSTHAVTPLELVVHLRLQFVAAVHGGSVGVESVVAFRAKVRSNFVTERPATYCVGVPLVEFAKAPLPQHTP